MPALTLALLGSPQVIRADGGAVAFRSRKHLALLAYLAVEQAPQPQPRYPARPAVARGARGRGAQQSARGAGRSAPAAGRGATPRTCSPAATACSSLPPAITRSMSAAFSAPAGRVQRARHDAPASCDACMARLAQAVGLYRGEFLAGFALPDSAAFEEWALDPARAAAPAGARGARHAGRAYEQPGRLRRAVPRTPAASSSWSPGASRPTASSCAAWRSRATAARRWRSTRRCRQRAGGRAGHRAGGRDRRALRAESAAASSRPGAGAQHGRRAPSAASYYARRAHPRRSRA